MTGTVHTQNPIYSRLTLALLEDSGWYLPNYDMVGHLFLEFITSLGWIFFKQLEECTQAPILTTGPLS